MCGFKYGVTRMYGSGETDLIRKTWCNCKFNKVRKSVDNEDEVKVRWYMPG